MKIKYVVGILCTLLLTANVPIRASTPLDLGEYKDTQNQATNGSGSSGGEYSVHVDNISKLSPKVTALHSLNALMAANGDQVYYIPTLQDVPGLKERVTDSVDFMGNRFRFSAVYDGYFNTECQSYIMPDTSTGRYMNKSITIDGLSETNKRALNILGYDALLTNEKVVVSPNGASLRAEYQASIPSVDQTSHVTLDHVLMNIYKALGQDKQDITLAFTRDPDLTLENSPVANMVPVSDYTGGTTLDVEHGKAWVFVTRTNPDRYWKQAMKDGIIKDQASTDGIVDTTITNQFSTYAASTGTWVQNETGWWYDTGGGTWLANGLFKIDGKMYLFDANGYIKYGWQTKESQGIPADPLNKTSDPWYYFGVSGAMSFASITQDGYYVDSDGVWRETLLDTQTQLSNVYAVKTTDVTLKEFCKYAYTLMDIYGEPVMTSQERLLLLNFYGNMIPYEYEEKDYAAYTAISYMIAKGIISPSEDSTNLSWERPISLDYMLTLCMRIKDKESRMTYKDVDLTLNQDLLDMGYYPEEVSLADAPVEDITVIDDKAAAATYFDYLIPKSYLADLSDFVEPDFDEDDDGYEDEEGGTYALPTDMLPFWKQFILEDYGDEDWQAFWDNLSSRQQSAIIAVGENSVGSDPDDDTMYGVPMSVYDTITDIIDTGVVDAKSTPFVMKTSAGSGTSAPATYDVSEIRLCDEAGTPIALLDTSHTKSNTLSYQVIGLIKKDTEEYLHLRISSNLKSPMGDAEYLSVQLGTTGQPVQLSAGGGVYQNSDAMSFESSGVAYDDLVDMERKLAAQSLFNTELSSTDSGTYIDFKCGTPDTTTVKYTDASGASKTLTLTEVMNTNAGVVTTSTGTLTFSKSTQVVSQYLVLGYPDITEFKKSISSSATADALPCFIKSGNDLLVPLEYLETKGLIDNQNYVDSEVTGQDNTTTVKIVTNGNIIYINEARHYVLVGSTFYNVPEDTKLVQYGPLGELNAVNYRAVLGWGGHVLTFSDANGAVIPVVTGHNMSTNKDINLETIKHNAGDAVSSFSMYKLPYTSKTNLLLSSSYPMTNYFVWKGKTLTDGDYLIVAKNAAAEIDGQKLAQGNDDVVCAKIKEITGFDFTLNEAANWQMYLYPLYPKDGDARNPKGIKYSTAYGYSYEPPMLTTTNVILDFNDYATKYYASCYSAEGAVIANQEWVLPFVQVPGVGGKLVTININYNTVALLEASSGNYVTLDYGTVPTSLVMSGISGVLGRIFPLYYETTQTIPHSGSWAPDDPVPDYKITVAPVAILQSIIGVPQVKAADVLTNDASVYVGTMKAITRKTGSTVTAVMGSSMEFDLTNASIMAIPSMSSATKYAYGGSSVDINDVTGADSGGKEFKPNTKDGASPNSVDWGKYKLGRLLQHFDGIITICTIAALVFIPRIMFFLFLSLIALSLIADVKPWQMFCDNVFDIYKLLTFRRRDVHTVDIRKLFVGSIIGMVIAGLFMDGLILNVIAWFARFLVYAIQH